MKKFDVKYDFDDILLVPDLVTHINHRKNIDISPTYGQWVLPLMTAPMDTVVNLKNIRHFKKNGIVPILPRTISYKEFYFNEEYPGTFFSTGIDDLYELIKSRQPIPSKICIDVANGHMQRLFTAAATLKNHSPKTKIMVGNIANPHTYSIWAQTGNVDYIRVGIGNGNACLTTKQTSIGYPKASLIKECNEIKKDFENPPKIVADGGMKGYSDIIKALALGADYVMVGSLFNKALESAAPSRINGVPINIPYPMAKWLFERGTILYKEFYGMSTKKAQRKMGKSNPKTSEGVTRIREVEYSLYGWIENFKDYLRSTMSYCNANNLHDFIGQAEHILITENAFNRFNK